MKRLLFVASLALGVASVVAACGGSGKPSDFGSGDDASVGDDASAGDDGGLAFDGNFGSDSSGCATRHCSSDLHQVLDCNDTVVTTCAGDQGCAAGACVAACDAAKANKSTVGCDYFSYVPDAYSSDNGDCYAAFIANTWGSPITITVDRGGQTFNAADFARIPSGSGQATTYGMLPNGQIPPGQVAILFLAGTSTAPVKCPAGVTPAFNTADAATHGTGIGTAFHIALSAPVVAYDIYPYGGGNSAITSATLLLPTTAWDTNYIAIDGYTGNSSFLPWVAIVAAEATDVTLSPTAAIVGGPGVAATGLGVPHTYSLTAGQVLQFTQVAELIGTPIQSTKPIGVFGGITCMNVPTGAGACDAAHQMIPPVKALGHEYVGVRHRDRYPGKPESPPWRIVGAVDGTTLTYLPTTPPGAPTMVKSGQLVEFAAGPEFIVKSQDDKHPFYMANYMTGCTAYWTGGDCRGDPEFVNVIPPQQYLASYVFFTDPTYPETHLVLVRTKSKGAFQDVTLDCAGVLTGWQPVGTDYEFTRIDLVSGNFAKQGMCDNGRHEAHSAAPFGLTVWGWGSMATGGAYRSPGTAGFYSQAVSYAYPAGASVQAITTVVVPPTPR